MKSFKELQVGDKIFVYAEEPFIGRSRVSDYYSPEEFISGIYIIKEIENFGFCRRFKTNTIIGTDIYSGEFIINIKSSGIGFNRRLYLSYSYNTCLQNIFITTSEEEWLEKLKINSN